MLPPNIKTLLAEAILHKTREHIREIDIEVRNFTSRMANSGVLHSSAFITGKTDIYCNAFDTFSTNVWNETERVLISCGFEYYTGCQDDLIKFLKETLTLCEEEDKKGLFENEGFGRTGLHAHTSAKFSLRCRTATEKAITEVKLFTNRIRSTQKPTEIMDGIGPVVHADYESLIPKEKQSWSVLKWFMVVGSILTPIAIIWGIVWGIFIWYKPTPEKPTPTNSQWQPPELEKRMDTVIVNYGRANQAYKIKDLTNAVQFEVNNSPNIGLFQGYHPMTLRVLNNRLYIDLAVPTPTKPIQIKSGEIIDLPAGWQWNANSNVFEIVNDEVVPVFQEFYQYPNTFTVKGSLRSGDKVFGINNGQIQLWDFGFYEGSHMDDRIEEYFNYPANEYPGVLFNK